MEVVFFISDPAIEILLYAYVFAKYSFKFLYEIVS